MILSRDNLPVLKLRCFNDCVLCAIGVVNRGDSFRRRRSRSNSLAPAEQENEVRRAPPKEVVSHNVAMLGSRGVGKTALISQFMTSECINAYDRQRGESPVNVTPAVLRSRSVQWSCEQEAEMKSLGRMFLAFSLSPVSWHRRDTLADVITVHFWRVDLCYFRKIRDILSRRLNQWILTNFNLKSQIKTPSRIKKWIT